MKSTEEIKKIMRDNLMPFPKEYTEKDCILVASLYAKQAVNAKLEEAIQKSNEFGLRSDYPFVEKIRNSYNEMLDSLKL